MARYLLLSEAGDGVGLASRLKLEGHDARLWARESTAEQHGKGLIDFAEGHQSGEIILADCTGFGILMDQFRDEGRLTFAGSTFADQLEADRQFAEDVMKKAGIAVPKSKRARSWEEARKAVEELADGGKVALKPEGALSGNLPSYVASDPEDAAKMLEQFERTHMQGEIELTVQEFVPGVAVSTEGWFNGEEWLDGMFNHTIERKQFLAGDLGPSGGCSGNVVWKCDRRDPILEETLLRVTELLRERRYCGPIDINCVVNEKGVFGLEWTPRFGYDALPTLLCGLCEFDFGAFVSDCAREEMPDVKLSEGFAAGVRLTLPPYPSTRHESQEGVPLRGFEEKDERWFYPYNVRLNGEELESSGGFGVLGVVNGRGGVIGEAFARAYEICSRLKIPEVQYRMDLAEAILKDYREFKSILTAGESSGWHGVDLDGSIAWHRSGQISIGRPLAPMIARIRRWDNRGEEVRVVTARATLGAAEKVKVYDWIAENIGLPLEVTSEKDPWMIDLYDDRVVELEKNTGLVAV